MLLGSVDVGIGLVHFVESDQDWHLRCSGVVNGLPSLGHHPVISRNHQNNQVGALSATGTHSCECLVAGGVQKGDLAPLYIYLIRPDMLGNAASLASLHVRFADTVKQGGLSVVYVAQHSHDWRPWSQVGRVFVADEAPSGGDAWFCPGDIFFFDELGHNLESHLAAHNGSSVEIDLLVDVSHDAIVHHLLYDVNGADIHQPSQIADSET